LRIWCLRQNSAISASSTAMCATMVTSGLTCGRAIVDR
jgi:hypothetical protein